MVNIYEILQRAASLKEETALNSISPERAGGIMYDTLLALNDLWLQQGSALVISKIYASVAAMEADTTPVSDLTGKPLRPGQIVVIASSDSDNGSVYRYNGTDAPSWSLVGAIGNLTPVDSLDSDSTTLSLAAHQGKVLDGKISQLGQIDNEFKLSIDLKEADLQRIGAGTNGFITSTGDLDTSVSNAFFMKYVIKEGYGVKIDVSTLDAPRNDAKLWAIYSSETIFNSSTCVAISETNAKAKTIESFVAPANAKVLIVQFFYSGGTTVKFLQNTAIKTSDALEELSKDVEKKKRSNVFLPSAIVNTSLSDTIKDKYLDGILSLRINGVNKEDKYVISQFTVGAYIGRHTILISISKIDSGNLVNQCTFYEAFQEIPADNPIKFLNFTENNSNDIYSAECCVDLAKIGTELFSNSISTVDSDTYKNYGILPDCFDKEEFESALPYTSIGRLRREIRKVEIRNLDTTRTYLLKTFGYLPDTHYLSLEICTTDNFLSVYSLNLDIGANHSGIETILSNDIRVTLDFNVLNNYTTRYNVNAQSIPSEDVYKLSILGFEYDTELISEEELALTYNGEPMKLLEYGNLSKKFYLACGRQLFAANSILKQAYTDGDVGQSIELVYTFPEDAIRTNEFVVGINAAKELNNGQLIVNAAINSYSDSSHTDYSTYSIFYRWDGSAMIKLFDGSWSTHTYASGVTKRGGKWTAIWDFDNYENLVFITERCNHATGGRAWMSKDGGFTWYVIFNAFTRTNYDAYKVVQPSGWDPEHDDFQRPVPGTSSYPYSYFHIHGISYDRWRDNVIIVSGDATWVKGSYTAVWVLHNPSACTLYPASGDIPEGATTPTNPVKMLQCNWTRVGLYGDENPTGKNLQFVNTLPFKDFILFGSDCGGGGVNGIIENIYPQNIVSSNFKVVYPLNADNDNAITHCSGGILKLINGPYLWTFHREGGGFSPTSSDQKAAILSSYDGVTWKKAWDDDTFNYDGERGTKVAWGATMIGYAGELYLRCKGMNLNDNIIKRMVLRD